MPGDTPALELRGITKRFGSLVANDAIDFELFRGAKVLVLDEPTAVLTAQESQELFKVLRALADDGTSIVFISHKLNEVLEISHRVTVLRRGKKVDTVGTAASTERSLARLMVG